MLLYFCLSLQKMKKIIAILFCTFYLAAASGVTINLHYCGSKLKSVSLFENKDDKGCCKKKNKKCCHKKTTFIKVKDNHQSGKTVNFTFNTFKIVAAVLSTHPFSIADVTTHYHISNYHAPPVVYDNPIYLKNRVLII
jgi:acetyltransferase-like isoleucine patch superfamily enzyme